MNKLQNIYVKGSACQRAGAAFVCALFAFILAFTIAPSFAWSEPEAGSADGGTEISTADNLTTVTATLDNSTNLGLSATVTYDATFEEGKATRFTYNVTGAGDKPLAYKINSLYHKTSSGWISLIDPSQGAAKYWTDKNYFEDELVSPGEYEFTFLVGEAITSDITGMVYASSWSRFKITFTVDATGDRKTIDEIADSVVAQCKEECAKKMIRVNSLMHSGSMIGS